MPPVLVQHPSVMPHPTCAHSEGKCMIIIELTCDSSDAPLPQYGLLPPGSRTLHLLDASGKYRDTTIELRTRAGNHIPNTQVWELSRYDWHVLGESLSRFKNVERVSEACPVYNCHGLTFGSRRTQVTPPVASILHDDGFDRVLSEKEVRPVSWKWRKRSSVKIAERTYEEGTEAFHPRGKSTHHEAASCGQSARLGAV